MASWPRHGGTVGDLGVTTRLRSEGPEEFKGHRATLGALDSRIQSAIKHPYGETLPWRRLNCALENQAAVTESRGARAVPTSRRQEQLFRHLYDFRVNKRADASAAPKRLRVLGGSGRITRCGGLEADRGRIGSFAYRHDMDRTRILIGAHTADPLSASLEFRLPEGKASTAISGGTDEYLC
jgi:hypothetical protein